MNVEKMGCPGLVLVNNLNILQEYLIGNGAMIEMTFLGGGGQSWNIDNIFCSYIPILVNKIVQNNHEWTTRMNP